jgi:hypothetical protein
MPELWHGLNGRAYHYEYPGQQSNLDADHWGRIGWFAVAAEGDLSVVSAATTAICYANCTLPLPFP